jgi:hypothetical protein
MESFPASWVEEKGETTSEGEALAAHVLQAVGGRDRRRASAAAADANALTRSMVMSSPHISVQLPPDMHAEEAAEFLMEPAEFPAGSKVCGLATKGEGDSG